MAGQGRLHIGCSGWEYRHWRGDFYPSDLPRSKWLAHYAASFITVEVNNSFYRLPDRSTFMRWSASVPSGFVFAVKASRYLTHMKKLKEPEEPLQRFWMQAQGLEQKLGPVLYQLPPRWKCNVARLHGFLEALSMPCPQVIEFRDGSWYTDEVFKLLDRYKVSLCWHSMRGSEISAPATGPAIYIRLHSGDPGEQGNYTDSTLDRWAQRIREELSRGKDVYVYFNNDLAGHAPRNARALAARLTA